MPFFSRRTEPEDEAVPVQQHHHADEHPKQRSGLFGSRRSPSPPSTANTHPTNNSRYSSGTATSTSGSRRTSGGGGLLHRFGHGGDELDMDPSIVQARERVMRAEGAEREADRALAICRREVSEARGQVRALELEAKEEARRAKIKQYHAKEVSKRGKALGRHDY